MKDAVIVDVAIYGREDYPKAQDRLIYNFIDSGWDGKFLMFSDRPRVHERGVEIYGVELLRNHKTTPYGFKVDAISLAREAGYKKIMWADSTIIMLRNFDELWNIATIQGVVAFHNLGHPLHKYISDVAALKLGILNRPEFKEISQIMACAILFDFDQPLAEEVFLQWRNYSHISDMFQDNGSSRPDFKAHRHDQAILSALLWKKQIPLANYGTLVYEPHDKTLEFGQPYLLNKGL